MKKYIVIELAMPDYEDASIDDVDVQTRQFSFEEFLQDKDFRAELMNRGWVDTRGTENIDTTNSFGPRVVVLTENTMLYNASCVTGSLVDTKNPENILKNKRFGAKPFFAVEIDAKTLGKVAPESLKLFQDVEARSKGAEKAQQAAEARRQQKMAETKQKKEQRKIENAKKLLVQLGMEVQDKNK